MLTDPILEGAALCWLTARVYHLFYTSSDGAGLVSGFMTCLTIAGALVVGIGAQALSLKLAQAYGHIVL